MPLYSFGRGTVQWGGAARVLGSYWVNLPRPRGKLCPTFNQIMFFSTPFRIHRIFLFATIPRTAAPTDTLIASVSSTLQDYHLPLE